MQYFIVEGDYQDLHGVYINGDADSPEEEGKQDQLCDLFFDKEGRQKFQSVSIEEFQRVVVGGAILVQVGFIP